MNSRSSVLTGRVSAPVVGGAETGRSICSGSGLARTLFSGPWGCVVVRLIASALPLATHLHDQVRLQVQESRLRKAYRRCGRWGGEERAEGCGERWWCHCEEVGRCGYRAGDGEDVHLGGGGSYNMTVKVDDANADARGVKEGEGEATATRACMRVMSIVWAWRETRSVRSVGLRDGSMTCMRAVCEVEVATGRLSSDRTAKKVTSPVASARRTLRGGGELASWRGGDPRAPCGRVGASARRNIALACPRLPRTFPFRVSFISSQLAGRGSAAPTAPTEGHSEARNRRRETFAARVAPTL